jgi:hypothetical protein
LPPDTTSINSERHLSLADFSAQDAAMSCGDITAEHARLAALLKQANAAIEANRTQNQVVGYIGAAWFPPALLAMESNDKEKDEIRDAYARQDTLIALGRVKSCGQISTGASPTL